MKSLTATLSICLLATPLLAQDGAGSITGTLDLEPARWLIVTAEEGPSSHWTESEDQTRIRLVGKPGTEPDGGPGTLIVDIDVAAGALEARATDVLMELRRADDTLTAGSENIDLTFTAFQASGDDIVVSGSLVATLTPDDPGDLVIDPNAGMTLDGNFQATVPASRDTSSN